jgi:hypothetical protein
MVAEAATRVPVCLESSTGTDLGRKMHGHFQQAPIPGRVHGSEGGAHFHLPASSGRPHLLWQGTGGEATKCNHASA